jgi:hypothetical protein
MGLTFGRSKTTFMQASLKGYHDLDKSNEIGLSTVGFSAICNNKLFKEK